MNNDSLSDKTFLTVLFIRIWLAIVRVGFVALVCGIWVGTFCMVFGGHEHLPFTMRHVEASIVDFHLPLGFLR